MSDLAVRCGSRLVRANPSTQMHVSLRMQRPPGTTNGRATSPWDMSSTDRLHSSVAYPCAVRDYEYGGGGCEEAGRVRCRVPSGQQADALYGNDATDVQGFCDTLS